MDAVVAEQPALGRLERRRPQPDLAGVPPGPVARLEHQAVVAPVAEVGRERDPHVGPAPERRGAMDHRPAAVEPAREQRRILVLGRHRRAQPADLGEVAGHRQRHERSAAAVRRVGDRPLLPLREPRQPGILAAPDLLRVILGSRGEQRRRRRTASPTRRPRSARPTRCEMPRRSSTRARSTVSSPTRAAPGLNTELARYGSWRGRDDRVRGMALEQRGGVGVHGLHPRLMRQRCAIAGRSRARMPMRRSDQASAGRIVADVLERGQPHEGRLGALVAVHAGRLEAVEAARPCVGSAIGRPMSLSPRNQP